MLIACTAQPTQAPKKPSKTISEVLWPTKPAVIKPEPVQVPVQKSVQKPVHKEVIPLPKPRPQKSKATRAVKSKDTKNKPSKIKTKAVVAPQRVVVESGPDLPWSCSTVRLFSAGKSRAQMEAQGRSSGVSLSTKQRRQAADCFR